MAGNLKNISQLAYQTAKEVHRNPVKWMDCLKTTSRLYKYTFSDQLLIYAQRPDATACAYMEQWNNKMHYWVKAGSKGIAVIRKHNGERKLRYLFDIADTRPVKGAKIPLLWEISEKHKSYVIQALEKQYGVLPTENFVDQLMDYAARAVAERYSDYLSDMKYRKVNSFFEELDELNTEVTFHNLLTASVQYMVLSRCGIDPSVYFNEDDFQAITNFNTPRMFYHFGNAVSELGGEIIQTIGRTVIQYERQEQKERLVKPESILYNDNNKEFNTLKHESKGRSVEHGRTDLHESRRVSDSRSDIGYSSRGHSSRTVRTNERALLRGTSQWDLHGDVVDGRVGRTLISDRPASQQTDGYIDYTDGETRRRERNNESNQSAGMDTADEQYSPESRRNRAEGTDLHISHKDISPYQQIVLFPTPEEQIEQIVKSKAVEQSTVFSLSSVQPVTEEVVNRILTSGSNQSNSVLRIAAFYQKEPTIAEAAAFLEREYQVGGKGFKVNRQEYSVKFDNKGICIAPGRTTNTQNAITISWIEVATQIKKLLEIGQYATKTTLELAIKNERKELAKKLWYLYRDFSSEATERNFLPQIREIHGSFPESTDKIEKLLEQPEQRNQLLKELQRFEIAYQEHPNLLNFRTSYSQSLIQQIRDLDKIPKQFPTIPDFVSERPVFITQDEIDNMLRKGGNIENGKMRIYVFYMQKHNEAERISFLKEQYGTGGYAYTGYNENHDAKGISFTRSDDISKYDTIFLDWKWVDKRISELITQGTYLSVTEQNEIPEYEKTVLMQNIRTFFAINPNRISEKDINLPNTLPELEQVNELRIEMQKIMASVPLEHHQYVFMERLLSDVTDYCNGTYSLFLSPVKKEAYEQKQLSIRGKQEESKDELEAVAQRLSHKKTSFIQRAEYGQLSLDSLNIPDVKTAIEQSKYEQISETTNNAQKSISVVQDSHLLKEQEEQKEELLTLKDVESYLQLKAQYPDCFVGVVTKEQVFFYGKDTETVSKVLNSSIWTEEIDGLGNTSITRSSHDWQFVLKNLLEHGQNVVLAEHGEHGYEVIKQCYAKEYIPIGMELEIEERRMKINQVDFTDGTVSLQDLESQGWFPIFRKEPIHFIRSFIEEQETQTLEPSQNFVENVEKVELDGGTIGQSLLKPHQNSNSKGQNFHIQDVHLGEGGAKAKYQKNIEAILTLKKIEEEERYATLEEQEILSRYVGWGGVSDVFDESKENWKKEYIELKDLLTPKEYESARSSVLNAHYTSPTVIKAMYQAIQKMELPVGNILEPACGIGNFFGLLPEELQSAHLYGIELDSLTGRIAKQLYPNANITISGFEKSSHRDFYDLVVGNVPFGDYKVLDKEYDKFKFPIHDYFLAKSIDQLRPGGILAVITSMYTMDKQNTEARQYLAKRADLLGAIRLPNNAFKANAGTEVTTDILFFQKRDQAPSREPAWVNLAQSTDGITVNQYFLEHPDMILGSMKVVSGRFGQETVCQPIEEANLSEQLTNALTHLMTPNLELLNPTTQSEQTEEITSLPATPNVRNFSYTLMEDKIYYRENSTMHPISVGKTQEVRIKGMLQIRDCVRTLIELQLQGADDDMIHQQQVQLNNLYDHFVQSHGLLNSLSNKQAFQEDSSYPLLCSLEVIGEEGKLERKADMFSKRTIQRHQVVTSVDTSVEALTVSIGEKACVDLGYMASLMGGKEYIPTIVKDLKGVIFKDPLTGSFNMDIEGNGWAMGWQTADEYLSGDVRQKLVEARKAVEIYPEFIVNVKALEQIQPKDLSAAEIDVRIGASWIDHKYYKQFLFELLKTPKYLQYSSIDILYSSVSGEWNVKGKRADSQNNPLAYNRYGTKRRNAYAIFEDTLNQRDTRIFDTMIDMNGKEKRVLNAQETAIAQQKQEAIGEAFKMWIFKDQERRTELCRTYNTIFNSTRPREFDGSHIRFYGMNPEIKLRTHQSNAVAHQLYGNNTLLAHCVGAGKTFTMIAAAMEAKRLGLCQKSLFIVPNHLTEQWGSDFLRLYPGANVLVATKKDFEPAHRKKFCARIATGDFDAVIIGHTQFEKIPLSPERQKALIENQIDEITHAIQEAKANNGERYTIKQMEKMKKGLMVRLEKLNDVSRKDQVVTFEELGVDRLFVDESHFYKNLFLHTKMRNVAGIAQSEAQKSSDMFAKCRYMDELTGGRGITFATGTPVSNSMVELYTVMRYLQFDTLQKRGLGHFDSWAADFGEKVTAIELSPEGTGFRSKTRFAKFFNLPELMSLWKDSADIQTAGMLNLPVPKAKYITITTEPSEHQQEMVADLAERAEEVRQRKVEPNIDNMLKITNDGRKLALDQRLQNELLPNDPGSKVNACIQNIFTVWQESTDTKGTQLVFCDLSTPHYDGTFNIYDDIKNKLIRKGIPTEEIAYIHDANTEIQKAELFSKVRKGQVRVLLGSTPKMGAGTNVQKRLIALHHLDCPWRPSDIEQREGRILRQGNDNSEVKIFKYVTKSTFDAYNWGLVENKQKFIGQIMTSKSPARSAEDVDATALSYAEVKALATGDDRIREKMELDIEVSKLKMLKSNHTAQIYELEDKITLYYPQKIAETNLYIDCLNADLPTLVANPIKEELFTMTIQGNVYTERKEAGEAIIAACKTMTSPDEKIELGEYRGFPMILSLDRQTFKISMKQNLTYTTEIANDPLGNITRINNALEKIPNNLKTQQERLISLQNELEQAKEEMTRPFPKEEELIQKSERLTQLNKELDLDGKSNSKEQEPDKETSILKALKQFEPSSTKKQEPTSQKEVIR